MLLDLHDDFLKTKIINSNVFYKEELESTNREAKKLISNYGIVACDKQTHGHGRHGRKWISTPYKDLAFTIIIPNDCNINGQNLVDLACESIVFNLQKLDVEPTPKKGIPEESPTNSDSNQQKDKEIVYEKKEFDKWMKKLIRKNGITKY